MPLSMLAPPGAVRSIEQLLAIAQAMEHEAATRYAELAARARGEGNVALGDLFERLAEEERGHEASVRNWSEQRGSAAGTIDVAWELPETFDDEWAEELAVSRLANAYRILSMAVRNEERAFTFWSYIAAEAETPEIREAAEKMAMEELGHVSLLRRARRQAYHERKADQPQERRRSVADRLEEAAILERHLALRLDTLAGRLAQEDQGEREHRAHAHDLASQAHAMADEIAGLLSRRQEAPEDRSLHDPVPDFDMIAAAERLVEDYLDIGDLSRDETVALTAQSLARRAIPRLAWLRALDSEKIRS